MRRTTHAAISMVIGLLGFAGAQQGAQQGVQPAEPRQAEVMSYLVEGASVENASARLVASDAGLTLNYFSKELVPGHAYTAWWVVFNDPEGCAGSPCEGEDMFGHTDRVQGNLTYAGGLVADENGVGNFFAHLPVGEMPDGWFDHAFDDPWGAEVHIVINDHGPVIDALVDSMTSSYRGGCTDESLPANFPERALQDGVAGPNTCRFYEFAIFIP